MRESIILVQLPLARARERIGKAFVPPRKAPTCLSNRPRQRNGGTERPTRFGEDHETSGADGEDALVFSLPLRAISLRAAFREPSSHSQHTIQRPQTRR